MLFSQPDVAEFLGARFEPVWQSVREAPQVTVDFGSGHVVRRTLHGNVATWILDREGCVIDVLGGVYAADAYRARLGEALALHDHVRPRHPRWADHAAERFTDYHRRQAQALAQGGVPLHLKSQGVNKAGIERWALVAMGDGTDRADAATHGHAHTPALERLVAKPPPMDVSKMRVEAAPRALGGIDPLPLAADVKLNETVRRQAIHAILAETGLVPFDDALVQRIYRDGLHCDLADPWLGLGPLLFGSYPFER